VNCLKSENLVKPEVPELPESHTTHNKWVWEYCIRELMNTEIVSDGNLWNLFTVLMSHVTDTKSQVESMHEYSDLDFRP